MFHPDSLRIRLANLKVDTKVGLRRTAKLKNFLCYRIKIMNSEMFKLYDLLKESKM